MKVSELEGKIPQQLYDVIYSNMSELRPAQAKSIKAGLLEGASLLVCTPTASGKTLIAELAALSAILNGKGKAVYIVPLKALASEKYNDFKKRYGSLIKTALSIGDIDSSDSYLANYDLIVCTAEKLDSLLRHHSPWLGSVKVLIVDEIHLLNDPKRGPTLELLITILKQVLKNMQLIALSATIGNAEELAEWLQAKLITDSWRPVKLHQGIYLNDRIEFKK
ncbi:DEAD/DEAH box helicase [Candidatus Woesearchaeota archaeon]|nr:DEAD/DEAH box helicase [Candidatus Woesearchaeota archaeon]